MSAVEFIFVQFKVALGIADKLCLPFFLSRKNISGNKDLFKTAKHKLYAYNRELRLLCHRD